MDTPTTIITKSPHRRTYTGKADETSNPDWPRAIPIGLSPALLSIRLFVDVKNGEPFPRKSILKSRSRENSVCSDTSESSAADFEERRAACRSLSHEDGSGGGATYSDTSDGVMTEEDSPTAVPLHPASRFEVRPPG